MTGFLIALYVTTTAELKSNCDAFCAPDTRWYQTTIVICF